MLIAPRRNRTAHTPFCIERPSQVFMMEYDLESHKEIRNIFGRRQADKNLCFLTALAAYFVLERKLMSKEEVQKLPKLFKKIVYNFIHEHFSSHDVMLPMPVHGIENFEHAYAEKMDFRINVLYHTMITKTCADSCLGERERE